MNSKSPRVQERIQDETMGRQEAVNRKSLRSRIPIRLRKRTTRLRQAGCSAWTSTFFENGTDTLESMTEQADEETSTLEPPSALWK